MKLKKRFMYPVIVLCLFSLTTACKVKEGDVACRESYGSGEQVLRLATGSPGELGLLSDLAGEFNKENDITLCWVKAGSGKSLALLQGKKVDVVMVHAPAAEKKAVKEGWAVNRTLLGSNEFYIVGPAGDPAGIRKAGTSAEAFKKIAAVKSKFMSRGDNSGTHKKEMFIWESAGITPSGDWYVVTGDFMMATLKMADKEKGYFMTDSSTWVAAKKEINNLDVLFKGDRVLVNTYNALCQPEGATAMSGTAAKFIEFLASGAAQKIIRTYGSDKYGEPLYNDAAYAKKYDR